MFLVLIVAIVLGVPVAWSLGLASLVGLVIKGSIPSLVFVQRMFTGGDQFALLAIPFFILAGNIMQEGGISKRLIRFANSLVGSIQGGLSLVTIAACVFFGALSGSSVATTAAIGSFMYPEMLKQGYPDNYATAVSAVGGTLGIIIPPSIVFVLYGIATNTSIGELFMSGIIPGILSGLGLIVVAYIIARRRGFPRYSVFSWSEVAAAAKDAFWALLMPLIVLGGIYGGIFTPTEAAVIAVVYGLIVAVFVYHEASWRELYVLCSDSALVTVNIMFLVVMAILFGWLLTIENVPQQITQVFLSLTPSRFSFFLFINIFLLIAGMFLDIGAITLIVAPLLLPIAEGLGIHPVHLGLVMTFNLSQGQITPPFGTCLFVAAGISGRPIMEVFREVLPFLAVQLLMIVVFSWMPGLAVWLPQLLTN
ncbi:MAG: TRAP transporter large permease [Limnochordia bacterium]